MLLTESDHFDKWEAADDDLPARCFDDYNAFADGRPVAREPGAGRGARPPRDRAHRGGPRRTARSPRGRTPRPSSSSAASTSSTSRTWNGDRARPPLPREYSIEVRPTLEVEIERSGDGGGAPHGAARGVGPLLALLVARYRRSTWPRTGSRTPSRRRPALGPTRACRPRPPPGCSSRPGAGSPTGCGRGDGPSQAPAPGRRGRPVRRGGRTMADPGGHGVVDERLRLVLLCAHPSSGPNPPRP